MLLRPRERKIWADTKDWLNANSNNKLLFVIDEAHMYRGSSGGEVALLIRRLFHKLGISRDRVQFILTTASMPDKDTSDRNAVMKFACELTAANVDHRFCYLTGKREEIGGIQKYDISFERFSGSDAQSFEGYGDIQLTALNDFWANIEGCPSPFTCVEDAYIWMFDHLIEYKPFNLLIGQCRGNAVSLRELASTIFQGKGESEALNAVGVLLAIAPLAKSKNNAVLFPARMHMLFKGIKGVYACANEKCPHAHTDGALTLGDVFLSDRDLICPHCGSVVYELYNDRRCGALFYKGYVLEKDAELHGNVYLWRYSGQIIDQRMKEIHLYIPPKDYDSKWSRGLHPCYLDVKSGFINFSDDSLAGKDGVRKLYYYCSTPEKGRPPIITFSKCPHCRHQLSSSQLTSFSTRGNQSFFNLIKAQFQAQPAVPGKDNDPIHLPNEGRKVLLFSDSRQRAAKLARDMSDASDITAARQLFALAIYMMEKSTVEQSMDSLYDYFCLAASQRNVQLFSGSERTTFCENCASVTRNYNRSITRNKDYSPNTSTSF